MLNQWQTALLTLIRSAILGTSAPLSPEVLTDELLNIVTQQQIIPIVYYGALNCGISPQQPQMDKLLERTVKLISIAESQTEELQQICAVFEKSNIDFMLLKGSVLKQLYPKPEMRAMSDADVLIRMEQYEQIKLLMRQLGFKEGVESDHELHWSKPTLHLELHKRLIPSYNRDYAALFANAWELAQAASSTSHSYQMSAEDTYLYLFIHFAKHYRDGGIGAKHLIDLWLYRKANPAMDDAYVQAALAKLKLTDFHRNICAVEAMWFEASQATELTEHITQVLLSGGAYGTEELQRVSWGLRIAGEKSSGKKVRRRLHMERIFLPYWRMCLKYPFLRRLPFLLPIMWPVRWVSALLFRREKIKTMRDDTRKFTEASIENYRDSLHYVGLSYEEPQE